MARKQTHPPPPDPDPANMTIEDRFGVGRRLPPNVLLPVTAAPFAGTLPTNALAVEQEKLNEIGNLLWFPEGLEEKAKNARIVKAIDLFDSVKPSDGIEAMLAVHMVGTHAAIAECLRRAMLHGQTFEGRNANLAQAQKLMKLYLEQFAALDKHRGKGHQKVTVEYVNVESGGQAIVGTVETKGSAQPGARGRRKAAPPQIGYAPPVPNPLDGPLKARRRRKAKGDLTPG